MSSEDVEVNPKNNEKMVSKAVFNKLIIITIITIGVAAFFAGTYTSNLNSDQVSEKELNDAIPTATIMLMMSVLNVDFLIIFSLLLEISSKFSDSITDVSF